MEAINQLKTLRDDALGRLQANPDFKMLNSLTELIGDLENTTLNSGPKFRIIEEETEPEDKLDIVETSESVDEAFEKITAELRNDGDADSQVDSETDEEDEQPHSFVSFN